jgi:hypothetical protein
MGLSGAHATGGRDGRRHRAALGTNHDSRNSANKLMPN